MPSTLGRAADEEVSLGSVPVSVAVVPQTPLLVPEIAAGAAGELETLRSYAIDAVREVTSDADRVLVLAPGPADARFDDVAADFTPYGYGERSSDATGTGAGVRPGSALPLGAWLLDAVGTTVPRVFAETSGEAVDLPGNGRTALVVLADGSAKRDKTAPGYVDVRALAFDAVIGTALASADLDALAALDPALAADLWASGVPAFRALAATVRVDGGDEIAAQLTYDGSPYGVAYWVAVWRG